jgi:hypothetical protein
MPSTPATEKASNERQTLGVRSEQTLKASSDSKDSTRLQRDAQRGATAGNQSLREQTGG